MSTKRTVLRTDLHQGQVRLDELGTGAIVVDQYGAAWQFGGVYWYRAYDSDEHVSSFQMAQSGPYRVIQDGTR